MPWGGKLFRIGARHRIIDDRRRIVPLCSAGQLPADATSELRAMVWHANIHRVGATLAVAVAVSVGMLVVRWVIEKAGGRTSAPGLPPLPARGLGEHLTLLGMIVLPNFVIFLILNSIFARRSGIAAVRTLHAAGLCPSCAYSVRGVPAEADGCVVCPECAAAWREGADKVEKG